MTSGTSAYRVCFAGCCFLTALSFVVSDYLPMVDLPEHAAQLSIWQQWNDPAFGHQATYEFHPFVPLQTAYLLVVILGFVLPLQIALKVAVLGLVLGVPLSTGYMLKKLGLDPWLVFFAFPIAFSYSFYWGFINFLAAIPLVILLTVFVDTYSQSPTRTRALALGLFFLVLFLTHPLAFGYAGFVLGPLILIRAPDVPSAIRRALPLLLALSVAVVWVVLSASGQDIDLAPKIWKLSAGRLIDFFNQIVGTGNLTGLIWGLVVLTVPFVLGYRFHSSWKRRIPLTLAVVVFFTFPWDLWSVLFVYRRFAVFTLPLLLFALQDSPDGRAPARIQKMAPVTLAVIWLSVLNVNFYAFGKEASQFDPLIQRIPPHKKVLNLALDYESPFVPGPVYAGFAKWYQVERGGTMDPSFAGVFHNRFQYRSEVNPDLPTLFQSIRGETDWSAQAAAYEYFIVRAESPNASEALRRIGPTLEDRLVPVASSGGKWWVFKRADE